MHIASRAAALLLISARWPSRTTLAPLLTEGSEPASFAEELRRRGLQTALDELADEGPSAFKSPTKVIEYVMLSLQHQNDAGIESAFRFSAREPGKSSFVSGLPLSGKRVAWHQSKFIGGYVSGKALDLDEFCSMMREHYAPLLGCATWRFAVLHPSTFEPLARSGEREYVREYVLVVDEKPVAMRLVYDWGCWCYLVYSVALLDGDWEGGSSGDALEPLDGGVGDDSDGDGRVRGRGGSL